MAGRRKLPTPIAESVIHWAAAGQSQPHIVERLREMGYPVHGNTVADLLSGRTYKELNRQPLIDRAVSRQMKGRRRREHLRNLYAMQRAATGITGRPGPYTKPPPARRRRPRRKGNNRD